MDTHQFFIDIAKACAKQSSCMRRAWGAVIVEPLTRQIISTGYNGAPRNKDHCNEKEWCLRDELNIPAGANYEYCFGVHAEQNALLQAGRSAQDCILYLYGEECATGIPITAPQPCFLCTKMLLNAGIDEVIIKVGSSFVSLDINILYETYSKELFKNYSK